MIPKLSKPQGPPPMKPLLILAAIALAGFMAFRVLIGGQTVSWHQRLTVAVQTPRGEVSSSAVTSVINTETNGVLVLPEARGVRGKIMGEAVAVEVLPGRWLFTLLSGDGWQTDAAHWVYPAYGLESAGSYQQSMSRLMEEPLNQPVPLPPDGWPMLVTFDDITQPETVRLVDPDDLDATFGCERESADMRFPWRDAGLTYRAWVEREVTRLSREMAAERSGVTGLAGDAIAEMHFTTDDKSYTKAEEAHIVELRLQFTRDQQRQWEKARGALMQELPATLPAAQSIMATAGGPCHQIKAVTLEVTDVVVTEGRIEEVLGWIHSPEYREDPGWAQLPVFLKAVVNGLKTPIER
jgi:hypothetical protein